MADKGQHTNYSRITVFTAAQQPRLLRDILGNPLRKVEIDRRWITTNVVARARQAYEDRQLPGGELDPTPIATLARALEEAGAEGELLSHLRVREPHVRGCWAVDHCLEKS